MLIYMAHPVRPQAGETIEENLARAKRWLRHLLLSYEKIHPIAPWIPCCEVLDDSVESNRNRGMRLNAEAIRACQAVWLVGSRISSGMKYEAEIALAAGIPVFNFTGQVEPPETPGKLDGTAYEG